MNSDMLLAAAEALPASRADTPAAAGPVLVGYGAVEELARFATDPRWAVHVPGHPLEVRRAIQHAVRRGDRAYVHVSGASNAEPRGVGEGFELVREGLDGVVAAVGATLDPVLRTTAGLDLTVLYTATVRPFDEVGLRTAVLAADHADVVLVEPGEPGLSARYVARTLVHVPHRLLALGGADTLDEAALGRAVRDFLR
ncbi:transketolase [Streptomyces sp. ISL-22]|uniref:transketolase n=1 Tax=unclassified Streptomyces TaxID=2593676 RepID=UPI001BE98542|nr:MULTISPECIES: transketolase [unclassified Streptomyces]MBT2419445.1 transketolase [Streptomyces sp. ISL-24]MBT2437760.1 transketolase [Streptomyces sp. ISL-22]